MKQNSDSDLTLVRRDDIDETARTPRADSTGRTTSVPTSTVSTLANATDVDATVVSTGTPRASVPSSPILPLPPAPGPPVRPSPPRHPTPTSRHVTHGDELFLEPGTMLGDYRIDERVAEGGWGTVYAATHPVIGKRAAVKVLRKELCLNAVAVQRFVDEARAVNQIGHPNIVDVFAFGETLGGRSYFMMEWLKGETLATRMSRGGLDVIQISAIVNPLAAALEAAHAKGIIHRDLKPDNVFLLYTQGAPPRVKLLDFGIAKLATTNRDSTPAADRTNAGEIVGTPAYMAPEQARGRQIDGRVDIYALGGILYELLTGRIPFDADNGADMIAKKLTEVAPRVSKTKRDVPRALDDLVAAMLQIDPGMRPTLAEVCSVLENLAARAQHTRAQSRPKLSMGMPTVMPPSRTSRAIESVGSAWRRVDRAKLFGGIGVFVGAVTIAFVVMQLVHRSGDSDAQVRAPVAGAAKLLLHVHGATDYQVLVDKVPVKPGSHGELLLVPGVHSITVSADGKTAETFRMVATDGMVSTESVDLLPEPTGAGEPK